MLVARTLATLIVLGQFAVLSAAEATETAAHREMALADYVTVNIPDGPGPHPLAVLLPGCLGWYPHHDKWRDELRERGYATLYIDSFGARGIDDRGTLEREVCTGQRIPGAERAGDLIAVIGGIWEREDIFAEQTIFLGWSHGGWTALDFLSLVASDTEPPNISLMPPIEVANVRAAFLFYPYCGFGSLSGEDGFPAATKTIIFHGAKDTVTDPRACRARVHKLRAAGADVEFVSLPQAGHWFDNHSIASVFDARATARASTAIEQVLADLESE